MADVPLPRRRRYDASLRSADYFIVRGLGRFLDPALRAAVAKGHAVLDAGCGEQPLRGAVEALGARYTGVDVRQNAARSVHAVAVADRLPFADEAFDVVLCTEVLEHVPDADAAFRETVRVTRRGGRIVLTAPFVYRLHEEPWDLRRVTPHQVRAWAASSGLDVERLDLLGGEIEVAATVWAGLLEQWRRPESVFARVPLRIAQRLLIPFGNVVAAAAAWMLGRGTPHKYALSVAAVLRRR